MIVSLIVAVSQNGVIGKDNRLLWKLSDDLKKFKEITSNHFVLMGRRTFESLGKPLPNRKNIIVTRNPNYECNFENCFVINSIPKGIKIAESNGENELFIIGGGELYAHSLEYCTKIYKTTVLTEIEGDTYFPQDKKTGKRKNIDTSKSWISGEEEHFYKNEKNEYDFNFQVLTKIDKKNILAKSNLLLEFKDL